MWFLQIVGSVPDLVSNLRQQDTKASSRLLDSVVELVDCLMFQHPGFPDLYEPVVDALKVRGLPLYHILTLASWTSDDDQEIQCKLLINE